MGRAADTQRLGYLLSKYPSANHTYLLHEVRGLRAAGLDVAVAAITGDDRPFDAIPAEDRQEREGTFVVKSQGLLAIAAAHAATLLSRPLKYVAGLSAAVALAGPDLRRLASHVLYFGEAVVVGRYLWRRGCKHVHTHYATTVAVIAARVYPVELSATIHGSAEFIDPTAQRLREKVVACAFVRAISMYGRSQLMLASPVDEWSKISVVRLGVNPELFVPAPSRPEPGPFRIAAVGQLQPAKGFHVLLKAVAALTHAGRDVTLTLVGEGLERDSLATYSVQLGISDRVLFTGALDPAGVRRVLREADTFVLSSFAEGIPVVLMEAMASELPCVASRITGVPELIADGKEGLLVTPSDDVGLVEALSVLIDSPRVRRELGTAARAKILRDYDVRANIAPLADLFVTRLGQSRLGGRTANDVLTSPPPS